MIPCCFANSSATAASNARTFRPMRRAVAPPRSTSTTASISSSSCTLPEYSIRRNRPPSADHEPRSTTSVGCMTMISEHPTAVHLGAEELPWADIGNGNKLKVIQVKEREGLWIVENIFQAGFEVQKHRHTGPVWGYTTSGAWKYKEYDYVNRAGSFLYEPAGSVHTLQCIEDDTR